MIISPETILYFLTGKQTIDHKLIIKLAKLKGVKVSDSMRKNIRNFLLCRNKPSETTLKNITLLLKDMVNNKQYSDKIDNISLLDEIDLSTPELKYKIYGNWLFGFFQVCKNRKQFFSQ